MTIGGRGIFHWSEEKTFQAVAQQEYSCVLLELRLKILLKHQKCLEFLHYALKTYFHNFLILPEDVFRAGLGMFLQPPLCI